MLEDIQAHLSLTSRQELLERVQGLRRQALVAGIKAMKEKQEAKAEAERRARREMETRRAMVSGMLIQAMHARM